MQGVALVFLKRSSRSLAGGGSSSFFLNLRAGAGRCASSTGLRLLLLFLSWSFFARSLSLAKCWPSSLPKSHSLTTVTWKSWRKFISEWVNAFSKINLLDVKNHWFIHISHLRRGIWSLIARPILLPAVVHACSFGFVTGYWLILRGFARCRHVFFRSVLDYESFGIRDGPGDTVKSLSRFKSLVLVGVLNVKSSQWNFFGKNLIYREKYQHCSHKYCKIFLR